MPMTMETTITVTNGRDVEDAQSRRHADEFGDQGQPVRQDEVGQGEPAPERAESLENGLGVSPLGDGAEADGHLLDIVGRGAQDDEEPEKAVAETGAGRGVGRDPAGVIVGHHDDDPRPGYGQEDGQPLSDAAIAIEEPRKEADRPPADGRCFDRGHRQILAWFSRYSRGLVTVI